MNRGKLSANINIQTLTVFIQLLPITAILHFHVQLHHSILFCSPPSPHRLIKIRQNILTACELSALLLLSWYFVPKTYSLSFFVSFRFLLDGSFPSLDTWGLACLLV